MTDDEWAIICTIRQQPDYLFMWGELRAARKLVEKGWLKEITTLKTRARFIVTPKGLRAYNKPR